MYRNLSPREEKLLQFLNATGQETVEKAETNQSNIEYIAMMTDVDIFDEEVADE